MTTPGLLSGKQIRQLLGEVDEQLAPGRQATVLIFGGSLLAWHGLRQATEDVDSSVRLDAELKKAVRTVSARHGLAADWLNDHSAPWHPATLRLEDCDVLVEHPQLRVLGAPLASVFLMKLNRSQPQDVTDMIALWPLVADAFPTARAATDAYYRAFPNEVHDEYLSAQVVDVARRAGRVLSLS
jgi:hypothetical protein